MTPNARRGVVALLPVALLAGCASSQDALVKRRDALRAERAARETLPELKTWRSTEGVRGVTWGMTVAEVIERKGAPAHQTETTLGYVEELDGVTAPTTYLFLDGHLAQVKSLFQVREPSVDTLQRALTLKWGAPVSDFDQAEQLQAAADSAHRREVAMFLASVVLSAGQPSPFWYPGVNGGYRDVLVKDLQNRDRLSRMTTWASPESRVRLLATGGGPTEVTWSSARLGDHLERRQADAKTLSQSL